MDNKREEFTKIYKENIDKIYRFVYLKVDSQESAEDITSKVFLRFWETYKRDKSIDNIRAFLYKVANNAVVDHYRDKSRTNIVSSDVVARFADTRTNLYDKSVLASDIESIKLNIQKLKKDYQDIIIWHYLDDMSIKEIAVLTGKSEGNIRVMVHRGLNELRKQFQGG